VTVFSLIKSSFLTIFQGSGFNRVMSCDRFYCRMYGANKNKDYCHFMRIRVLRPRGPGISKHHCKALALPPDSPKCWPIRSSIGQFAEVLARSPKGWPIRSSFGRFAQALTDHSRLCQNGKQLTTSLPRSAGSGQSVHSGDPSTTRRPL